MKKENKEKQLFDTFPKVSKAQWLEKATKDLKGEDPMGKFSWQAGDIPLGPYYDASDTRSLGYLQHFHNRTYTPNSGTGEYRKWINVQFLQVMDTGQANREALMALNNGAGGICFALEEDDTDLDSLLQGILPEHCYISFQVKEKPEKFLKRYFELQKIKEIDPALIKGHLGYGKSDHEQLRSLWELGKDYPHFKCIDISPELAPQASPTSPPEQALAHLLTQTADTMDILTEAGYDAAPVLRACRFTLDLGTDYFLEMCRLRTLRILLYQLSRAYQSPVSPEEFFLHALSSPWPEEAYQPHGDMLKSTSSAMAAIIGGCDALSVLPLQQDPMAVRIARNVSSILKEESYLDKTPDPMAGSYYLDQLTDLLLKKAWGHFLEQEKNKNTIN